MKSSLLSPNRPLLWSCDVPSPMLKFRLKLLRTLMRAESEYELRLLSEPSPV